MKHLLAYIHLNPLDIKFPDWKENPSKNKKEKKEFLASYRYSSYPDYQDTNRVEKSILNKGAFPEYFENSKGFNDFIKDYLTYEEDK